MPKYPWPYELSVKTPEGSFTLTANKDALTEDERKGAIFEAYGEAVQRLEEEQMKYSTVPPDDEDHDVRS